jgi:hypothetical protein
MSGRVCLAESGDVAILIGVPGRGDFFKEGVAALVVPDMPRSRMASLGGLRRRSICRPDIVRNWARIAGVTWKFGGRLERRKSMFCLMSSAR